MKTNRLPRIFFLIALAVAFSAASPSFAEAQKKAKAKPPAQQPKKEVPVQQEEVESDEPAVQPAPQANPATGGVLSWLRKYVDQKTNLGKLKEVTPQYIVVEDDNTTTIIPMTMIHSLKQIREEDPPSVRLEILLAGKD